MTATRDRAPVPVLPVPSAPAAPRREFVKCETPWCRTILGEWLARPDRLLTSHPAIIPLDGHAPIVVVCPHCGAHRLIEPR